MTWEHIAVLAGAVVLVGVGTSVTAWRDRRRIEARFDADRPVPPLPDVDPDGWSSQVGWSAWREWLELRTLTAPVAGTTDPAIFDDLRAEMTALAIEPAPRELTGASK